MSKPRLVIGNKTYSSWSLRGWLALKLAGIAFEEEVVPLDRPETAARLAALSPSGLVPVLTLDGAVIYESLAIVETAAERAPHLWPADARARGQARSLSAMMHAGFVALRRDMPMDLKHDRSGQGHTDGALADIAAIVGHWRRTRADWGTDGPFLFGAVGAVDVMFAPVVTRLKTYGVRLDADIAAYCAAVEDLPAMQEWRRDALAEPWIIERP